MRTKTEIEADIAQEDSALFLQNHNKREADNCIRLAAVDGIPTDELRQMAQARKEGRLVVLPYPIGTRLFEAVINCNHPNASYVLQFIFEWHTYAATIEGMKKGIVHTTREAAEKALGGEEK